MSVSEVILVCSIGGKVSKETTDMYVRERERVCVSHYK